MTDHEKIQRIRLLEGKVGNAEREVNRVKEELKAANALYNDAVMRLRNEITRNDNQGELSLAQTQAEVVETKQLPSPPPEDKPKTKRRRFPRKEDAA